MLDTEEANERSRRQDVGYSGTESPGSTKEKAGRSGDVSSKADADTAASTAGTTTDQSRVRSQSTIYSTSYSSSSSWKKEVLAQLGIKDSRDFDREDNESLKYFLQIKLEQERKEVERLRDANLEKLNVIIDKCSASKILTQESINMLFDIFINRQYDQAQEQMGSMSRPYSPERKRRKLGSPIMSPESRRKGMADPNRDFQSQYQSVEAAAQPQAQSQQQSHLQPPLLSPYTVQYQGGHAPTPWLPQQYGVQGQIPAGLGFQTRSPEASSNRKNIEAMGTGGTASANTIPQGAIPAGGQNVSYSQAGSIYPGSAPYFVQHGASGRPPLVMVQQHPSQESLQAGMPGYVQAAPQIQPPFRLRGDNPSIRRQPGHRRSQSSITPSSHYNNLKSPVRELQATPQKPVNFLIHTPKYPPPT